MEEILINREEKTCWNCNFRAKTAEAKCPRCHKKLKTIFEIQKRGIYEVVGGGILVFCFLPIALGSMGTLYSGLEIDQLLALWTFLILGMPSLVSGAWELFTCKSGKIPRIATVVAMTALLGLAIIHLYQINKLSF